MKSKTDYLQDLPRAANDNDRTPLSCLGTFLMERDVHPIIDLSLQQGAVYIKPSGTEDRVSLYTSCADDFFCRSYPGDIIACFPRKPHDQAVGAGAPPVLELHVPKGAHLNLRCGAWHRKTRTLITLSRDLALGGGSLELLGATLLSSGPATVINSLVLQRGASAYLRTTHPPATFYCDQTSKLVLGSDASTEPPFSESGATRPGRSASPNGRGLRLVHS